MPRPPSLPQLRAYRAVMTAGSLTKAADIMNLTQPALSKQITALEEGLDIRLFDRRRGGPMVPTKAGLAFYKTIEGTLHGIDTIPEIAQKLSERVSLRLRIAATPPLLNARPFMQALSQFRQANPMVKLALEARPRVDLEDWVASRQVDLGLGLLPESHPDLRSRLMTKTTVCAVVAPFHPLADHSKLHLEDLQNQSLILPSRQPLRYSIDAICPGLNADIESSSAVTCCRLAASGQGIALCDPFSPTFLPADAVKIIPFTPDIPIQYGALILKNLQEDPQIQSLIALISEEFAQVSNR